MPRAYISSACALLVGLSPHPAQASCRLPIPFPPGVEPSGATIGPQNQLVVADDGGSLIFVDLDDYAVRQDTALNDKYKDSYGWFDLEGIAMTSPESTYLYLGMENRALILEYEWHSSQKIFRKFVLHGLEHDGNRGTESITWVETDASEHGGYFYVGSQLTGRIYIYNVPLLSDTGPQANAELVSVWTPLGDNTDVAGLSYSSGFIFVNYDDGNSNHVLIYPVLGNGLPGDLREQYQVDVTDAEGIAVRKTSEDTWEVFFSSDSRRAVFAYTFRFESGFELHPSCALSLAGPAPVRAMMPGAAPPRPAGRRLIGILLATLAVRAIVV